MTNVEYMNKFEDYLTEIFLKEKPCSKDHFKELFISWCEKLSLDDWLRLGALFYIKQSKESND